MPIFPSRYDREILSAVFSFAESRKAGLFIVGGYLRDLLVARRKVNPDIDFCLKHNALAFGRDLAKKIGAGFVVLDKEHGCCRMVKIRGSVIYTLDIADFRAPTIEKDLGLRDFTMNTLAVPLEAFVDHPDSWQSSCFDPHNGRVDIKAKVVRMVDKRAFKDDPLRMLRAFSLSCIFDFTICPKTRAAIASQKRLIVKVSAERIRDELFKIFETGKAYECMLQLDACGLLSLIIPEIDPMRGIGQGPYHHLDVWTHTLESLGDYEKLIFQLKKNSGVQEYLKQQLSGQRSRNSLIKLGLLLHDVGKPKTLRKEKKRTTFHGHERVGREMACAIARRLKLANDEVDALARMVMWHLRPGYLADCVMVTARAAFRFFRDAKLEAPSILLLSIADQRATRGPLNKAASRKHHEKVALKLLKSYFLKEKEEAAPRLVTGDDLMGAFKLGPSPLIGKMLREIEELRAIGKIKTRQQALTAAKKLLFK